MKRFLIGALKAAVVLLVLGSPVLYLGWRHDQATSPKTDPQQYVEILNRRQQGGYGPDFFPAEIDPRAEKVAFYYHPGVMQGGTSMALRMKFPAGQPIPLGDQVSQEKVLSAKDFINNGFGYALRSAPSYQGDWEYGRDPLEELGAGYVFYLQSPDLAFVKEHWNHNEISYVAVSEEQREVFYYYSQW